MRGDFSTFRFDPGKHYTAVLLQQGRVLLDSDWNEGEAIRAHLWRTLVRDVLGPCAFPRTHGETGGFAIRTNGQIVTIGAGHAWIDGLLCENESDVDAEAQPDLPDARLPTTPGTSLLYLDVWQREVTAAEDPSLREPALGGADPSVRLATVWQVRWQPASDRPDRGQRRGTRTPLVPPDSTDARLAARGPYLGLENRLYRVEIHDPGRPGAATFKWSRDNGSTVAAVRSWNARELHLERRLGRRFDAGDQLELLDRVTILNRRPGLFVTVDRVEDDLVRLASSSPDIPNGLVGPLVRRWDAAPSVVPRPKGAAWSKLEHGVEVRLDGHAFRTGDYWLVPARTADEDGPGAIDWAVRDGEPQLRSPLAIAHSRCALALVRHDANGWHLIRDLRPTDDLTR